MPFETLNDKFVHHLQQTYYVENQLVDALEMLSNEVSNEKMQEGFEEHLEETRDHVQRLEDVFGFIDEEPQEMASPTFDALMEEREMLLDEAGGDEDLADLCNLGVALKNEHMEIAAYENMIMLAQKMDVDREVRNALESNLDDEEETKKQLKSVAEDSTMKEIFTRLTG